MTNKQRVFDLFKNGELDIYKKIYLIKPEGRWEAEVCGISNVADCFYIDWVQYDRNYEDPDEVWDEGDVTFDDYNITWTTSEQFWERMMKEKYGIVFDKSEE